MCQTDSDIPAHPILFVSSEGQAGVIAAGLLEALQLIIAIPFWFDCLKFSGNGQLQQMQRVVPFLDRELRHDEPNIDLLRQELNRLLDLLPAESPLLKLHQSVSRLSVLHAAIGTEGPFETLFNSFTADDNPMWKGAVE